MRRDTKTETAAWTLDALLDVILVQRSSLFEGPNQVAAVERQLQYR